MNDILELLQTPFIQRAFIGGSIVAGMTSLVGVFAVLRRASFFGDALAHTALTGVAIGLLIGVNPLITALGVGCLVSFLLPVIEQKSRQHLDTLLGVLLPVALAVGVLLLSLKPGYRPDIASYLFGSILTVTWGNIYAIIAATIFILSTFLFLYPKLVAVAIDPTYAVVSGLSVTGLTIIHNLLLTTAIIPSVSLVGIILVNALLIIPAAIAKRFATSLKQMFIIAPIISIITTLIGMLISIAFNLPAGPSIVTVQGVLFLITAL